MTEAAQTGTHETGILTRGLHAFELLFAAHAKVAKLEARADLARIVFGLIMAGLCLSLLSIAFLLAHAAAVLLIDRRYQCGPAAALGVVAAGDVLVAFFLFLLARSRLSIPVLTETRAMMKKAASVVRG